MTLAQWLLDQKITDEAFAEKVGISRSMVTRLRLGTAKPSYDSAKRIVAASGGKIGWDELTPKPPSPEGAAA